ncbi:LORF2 protein, partial [Crocuta crocuta]
NPAIALLGIYPRDTGVLFQRTTCTPMFTTVLLAIAKVWAQIAIDRRMDKEDVMYIYIYIYIYNAVYTMQYYSTIKKLKFCHLQLCMELEGIYAKGIKSEKDKYHMTSLICGI